MVYWRTSSDKKENCFFSSLIIRWSLSADNETLPLHLSTTSSTMLTETQFSDEDYIWLNCDGLTAVVKLNTESGQPQILCCPVSE